MATIPTQNAVPSEAPRDLKFNSGKIDEFVTSLEHEYKDRFGRCHMTIEGMRWIFEQLMERFKVDINQAIIAAGYVPMDSFQQGAEITKRNEILRDETTGEYYRWDGDLPKAVPAGSTPESAGGIGMGAWVSVGDASLRTEISDPDGAKKYPTLQVARWRDDMDVRGWGVFPDGSDVTERLCEALDYANGDYGKLVQYGERRRSLHIPAGDYFVDMTKLTGIHKEAGRFIIRCNVDCVGRIPDGDFLILHSKTINVTGLSCKTIYIRGLQFSCISNIDTTGDITFLSSVYYSLEGLVDWGGGSYWNSFNRIKTGTTSGGGRFIIDASDGSINQNTFEQLSGGGLIITGGGVNQSGIGFECNANIFVGLDTSGSGDYMLYNNSTVPQHNTVIGLYGEVKGNGRIVGPWTILGARAQFGGWVSSSSHMNTILGTDPTAGSQGGESISASGINLCPSGDWSVIDGSVGAPIDYALLSIPSERKVGSDDNEPGGCGRWFGVTNASQRCRITANLTKTKSGFIRGAFYFKGDTPLEVAIEAIDGTNTVYSPVSMFFDMGVGGWKLYRISSPTNDKSKQYRLRITIESGKSGYIGTSYFSSYNGSFLPNFCGWEKVKMRSSGKPTVTENAGMFPIGMVCYRTGPATYPTDPTVQWVWNGSSWGIINISG
ncbi:hypothetical protein Q4S25_17565 [Morganella morganii]